MKNEYYDVDQAKMRLQGSVIGYGEGFIYVQRVESDGDGFNIQYTRLNEKEDSLRGHESWDRLEHELISTKNMPLGFCNVYGKSIYLMRSPQRQWKEGINNDNLCYLSPDNNAPNIQYGVPGGTVSGMVLLPLFKGNYPSFDEALNDVEETGAGSWSAFDRNYAVSNSGDISFKGLNNVGIVNKGKVVLKDSFHFLKESLEERGVV